MMLNVTFNNILLISWQSVLLVEETGVPGEATDLPQVTDKLDHMYLALGEILTYTFRDDRYWLTYVVISSYHTITITTSLFAVKEEWWYFPAIYQLLQGRKRWNSTIHVVFCSYRFELIYACRWCQRDHKYN